MTRSLVASVLGCDAVNMGLHCGTAWQCSPRVVGRGKSGEMLCTHCTPAALGDVAGETQVFNDANYGLVSISTRGGNVMNGTCIGPLHPNSAYVWRVFSVVESVMNSLTE